MPIDPEWEAPIITSHMFPCNKPHYFFLRRPFIGQKATTGVLSILTKTHAFLFSAKNAGHMPIDPEWESPNTYPTYISIT
jgi:hypothetical protein